LEEDSIIYSHFVTVDGQLCHYLHIECRKSNFVKLLGRRLLGKENCEYENTNTKLDVLTMLYIKMTVLLDVAPCSFVVIY